MRASRISGCLAGLAVALLLILSACGGESTSTQNADGVTVAGGTSFVASTEAASANNGLPAVNMLDLSDGSVVNLATAAPNNKTIVLWFWAPH